MAETADETQVWIRLKPYTPRRGFLLRRYLDSKTGARFLSSRGWYLIPEQLAQRFADVRQSPNDPYSPLAFDIAMDDADKQRVEDEYRRLEEEARRRAGDHDAAAPQEYGAHNLRPGALSTDQLPRRQLERERASQGGRPPAVTDLTPPTPPPVAAPAPPPSATVAKSAPETISAAPDDKPLGVSLDDSRDTLVDVAENLGITVKANDTKAEILTKIEDAVQ